MKLIERIKILLKVKLLKEGAKAPTVAHPGEDLAYDLYAVEDAHIVKGRVTKVATGVAIEDTDGRGFIVKDRSSMASKGIFTLAGVIDAGYRGEIQILFIAGGAPLAIKAGDKVAQMIPILPTTTPVQIVSELSDSNRGTSGFGSTGAQ